MYAFDFFVDRFFQFGWMLGDTIASNIMMR